MSSPKRNPALWAFPTELSAAEEQICKRLHRTGRLFAFLRRHRHELFDDAFQAELLTMYADTPRGTPPKAPALLAMVTLLQAYQQKSDAAAVEEALFDRRWQMVLNGLGLDTPLFSQGVLVEFRRRLIAHDMDRRLIERTVELARKTGEFGHGQLRLALDSAPLWGAGRLEDTFKLIGHALRLVVECAAQLSGMPVETLCRAAQLRLVGQSSLKAALDIDWDEEEAQHLALTRLLEEVERVRRYLGEHLAHEARRPPLEQALSALEAVIEQDLEPDPEAGPGAALRLKQGLARDRRISLHDPEMRHGRKSRTRTIHGYKGHVVRDLDSGLLLGACVRPANEPEADAAEGLRQDVAIYGEVASLSIDRGYLASGWVQELYEAGGEIVAKAWSLPRSDYFTKADFEIDLESARVRCPQGHLASIRGRLAQFEHCQDCPLRARCTKSKQGRSIGIHEQEQMLLSLRALQQTSQGREKLRERVAVEHSLAHVCQRQGPRARYLGVRKNTFDVRRTAVIVNLHSIDRFSRAA